MSRRSAVGTSSSERNLRITPSATASYGWLRHDSTSPVRQSGKPCEREKMPGGAMRADEGEKARLGGSGRVEVAESGVREK
eukprot:1550885-Pleurochrysis_carterae.AAC.1